MRDTAPFGLRYQYLAGGVNTGAGWETWQAPPGATSPSASRQQRRGDFVSSYVTESAAEGMVPVFTYYMLYQSRPGSAKPENDGVLLNLRTEETMLAYWQDLKLFFLRAGESSSTKIVLHVEPDLWAFVQQSSHSDDGRKVPVKVAATGLADLVGLPDTMEGYTKAILRLRDSLAPNVLLAYHLSGWGSGEDVIYSNAAESRIRELAQRSITFYHSLGTEFDLVFAEFGDRDAAYKQIVDKNPAAWWEPGDFARHLRFLSTFVGDIGKRVILWQIPFGNTRMLAQDNTTNHYQDNKVETLLDDPAREYLRHYAEAGVIAFLFGRGADGVTCACDGNKDGVTNPAPINGNVMPSLSADDDGGFFRLKVVEYYRTGQLGLP